MKIFPILLKLFLSVGTLVLFFFFISKHSLDTFKAEAYVTECPPSMTTSECLVFLEKEKEKIAKDKAIASQKLSSEQYQQLDLMEKIAYLDGQIVGIEAEIGTLEIEIETKNVEIRVLSKDIDNLQNNINTATQEISRLQTSVDRRISMSYKYSFLTPVEILLESQNFENILRKMKYLTETRKKDREVLSELSTRSNVLKIEEEILAKKLKEVQEKRDEIEKEKSEVFNLKQDLSSQRAERSTLYAQSKQRESQLLAQIEAANKAHENINKILNYIQSQTFIDGGTIQKGQAIGRMGNKGCSTGAHLHFSISTTAHWDGYGNISPWSGYLTKGPDYWTISGGWIYYYIRSGSMQVPLAGPVVITQNEHQGTAIDLYSLQGEGAMVYAAAGGQVEYILDDSCGNPYVRIKHPGGIKTSYLHMNQIFVAN